MSDVTQKPRGEKQKMDASAKAAKSKTEKAKSEKTKAAKNSAKPTGGGGRSPSVTEARSTSTADRNGIAAPGREPRARPVDLEAVAHRAHALWEAEGRPHGRDQAHWHQAVREYQAREELQEPQKSAAPKKSKKAK